MNTNTHFDRLVDDELNEEERRALLGRLDDEPGGWRRCALAFLEAQCWKKTFGSITKESAVRPGEKVSPSRPRANWIGRLNLLAAMAASFLIAFIIGTSIQRAKVAAPAAPDGSSGEVANVQPTPPQPHRETAQPSNPWRVVTVSSPAGSTRPGSTFNLPAVERDKIDRQWLQNLPPAMPDNVVQAFNRMGHQVEQHRELVPMPLKDGRQMVVPVDQVDVKYVGDRAY